MKDDANFHLSGNVSYQKCRCWSTEKPRNIHQKSLHSKKFIVWCGVASFGVFGPYFFEDEAGMSVTVNSAPCNEMFRIFLESDLQILSVENHALWFQQDGVTAHTARTAMRVHTEMFPARVISQRRNIEWPARSSDLNACDFLLWG
jgi:hypothetical protein